MTRHKILSLSALAATTAVFFSTHVLAEDDIQDMSDPLAVFTQAGIGYTDKGINLKVGQTYDTGSDTTMGMNVFEVKGVAGETLGWNGRGADDSIDSFRYRNFGVDITNGRGSQVDVSIAFDKDLGAQGSASYSLIQALPKMGPVNLYPLAGLGMAFGEELPNASNGSDAQLQDRWDIHGTFYVAGLYSKVEITDKIWLNYNPMYMGTVSGSDLYKHHGLGGDDTVLLHEAAINYQINPRSNVRYFANWNENNRFQTGDHRIEYNYQF
ncbi:hypothetical protein AB4259_15385 [Vibrio amylolyticus]|uniref:hypothetical protein n=1 Tax=Vibrio TaxID=662 RepID=UPI000C85774C|nr:hypothetical protein [Vibrio sp. 10N.261.55.A7]PMK00594.1 hypothetical protein BCU12_20045 [Vibrio sp. 10N.261.55.A7]